MQRGLSKILMAGVPRLNPDLSTTVTAEDGRVVHTIPPAALTQGGIGILYERLVGLHYEKNGYNVEYRSRLGYLDAGVDLIARNENECRFIQCKFRLQSMSRSTVESLLFAASRFVKNNLTPYENHFDLVVPFEAKAFPNRWNTKKTSLIPNPARKAFLRYNTTQQKIRLHIVEIPLETPESFVLN